MNQTTEIPIYKIRGSTSNGEYDEDTIININHILKIKEIEYDQSEYTLEIFGYYFLIKLVHKKIEVYDKDIDNLIKKRNKIIKDLKSYKWIEVE